MPTFTLAASLTFSFFLIWRDCRRRKTVSARVWVPTMLILILGSRPASIWASGGTIHASTEMANDVATSSIDQMFYFSVLASSLILASRKGFKWGKLFASNPAIMLFYLYFAISIMWSSDPIGSTKRIIKDFGLLFVIAVVLSEKEPLQAMRAIYVRCGFLLLPLSIVFIKYFPVYGRSYGIAGDVMLTGVTTQKNSLGEIVLIFTLFMVWDYLESRPPGAKFRIGKIPWEIVILLVIGAQLLNLSQSKTALMCTLVGTLLICRSGWLMSKPINIAILGATLFVPYFVFFAEQFASILGPLTEAMGRNLTFTGRTDIWKHISLNTVNPIIGSGYWNFWGGPGGYAVNESMHAIIPNAHNGYVDLFLDGGITGLCILVIMLTACGYNIMSHLGPGRDKTHYHRARFAFLIVAIIYNISESTFARMGPIWFTTLMMLVEFPLPKVSLRKAQPAIVQREKMPDVHTESMLVAR
ncbi:O-antigen ligase [Acidobacterium sp. S8]|uniref:O-antigen ligase family protein n=1 Tax=Acidobacterium sp. S8 TaxID=1641854 RepID=UPI00131AFBE3|nr:O-antigen ligase family protein [Acidobacterium sp. S8]